MCMGGMNCSKFGARLLMFVDPVLAPGMVPGGLHADFGGLHADGALFFPFWNGPIFR